MGPDRNHVLVWDQAASACKARCLKSGDPGSGVSNSFPTSIGYQDTLGRTSGGTGEQAANLLMRFLLFSAPGA